MFNLPVWRMNPSMLWWLPPSRFSFLDTVYLQNDCYRSLPRWMWSFKQRQRNQALMITHYLARRGEPDFPRVNMAIRTGDGRLPMPVSHLGTLYLTVSRTLILLCQPSNAISRPSFFPHTRTFSAFEVSYKNAPYKSTVIIILLLLPGFPGGPGGPCGPLWPGGPRGPSGPQGPLL